MDLSAGGLFLIVLMAYYQVRPDWSLVWAPVLLTGLIMLTLGVSLILAAVNVRFRDIKYVIPFVIQLGLFVTPVIYPIAYIPERFRPFVALNPLSGIIEGFRSCLFGRSRVDPVLTSISLTASVIVLVVGFVYFRRAERRFADII
jgi:lipopolysaccharide transport system permease protein